MGSADCRAALVAFQRLALERRAAMQDRMVVAAAQMGDGFDLLGLDATFESLVIGLPFTFWQYQAPSLCGLVPGAAASDDEVYAFFDVVAMPAYATDAWTLAFEPYTWQAYAELGTPGTDTSAIDDLLTVDLSTIDDLPSIDAEPVFDPAAMQDVSAWLSSAGAGLLFVYGEYDPWTAGAFDLGGATDSYELVVPGGNHASGIAELAPADRQTALDALSRWAAVPIAPPPPRATPRVAPPTLRVRPRRR